MAPCGHGLGHDLAEDGPGVGVEPGMGLVEEPQLGTTGHEQGERHPPALAGGKTAHRGTAHPAPELEAIEHGVDVRQTPSGRSHREADVLDDGQVVVERGGVAEHAHPATKGRGVAAQITSEHRALAPRQREQAGAYPQQARLARPVRAFENDHFTLGDGEIDAGQGRKPPGHTNGGTEVDCGGHGLGPCYGGPPR